MSVGDDGSGIERVATDMDIDYTLRRDSRALLEETALDKSEGFVVSCFFLLGTGVLLPWNAFLSAIDYYSVLFPNIAIAQYITNAYTLPFMVAGTLVAVYPDVSRHRRSIVFGSFAILAVLSAMLPAFSSRQESIVIASEALSSKELWFTVFASAVIGTVSAVLQSVLFGTVTLFPGGQCTTAFTAGGGVASVFIACLRIFCRLLMDGKGEGSLKALRSGFQVFFITCSGLCAACMLVFLMLDVFSSHYRNYIFSDDTEQFDREARTFGEVLDEVRSISKDISRPAWSALVCFIITLTVFPGILVQIPLSLRATMSEATRTWYPLIVVSVFAVGDTVGRGNLTEDIAVRFPGILPLLTIVRALLVPLYLCQWLGLFPVNWVIVVVMVAALGVGNGVIVSLAFLSVPSLTVPGQRETAGRLLFVMLICGMSLGNMTSWVLETVLRRTTEF